MRCRNCDAELRPGAKFCPTCGTKTDEGALSSTPPAPDQTGGQGGQSGDDSGSGKIPRPPRPLRSHDETNASDIENVTTEALGAFPVAVATDEGDQGFQGLQGLQGFQAAPSPKIDIPPASVFDGDEDEEIPVEDAPTMEYNALAGNSSSPSASSPRAQAPEEAQASSPADGMPWPLPASMIVGGRYRVEELLVPAHDEPQPENIYRVSDLQAYEHCWACDAEHGIEAATEQYCPECGADMLARVFLMYERLLSSADQREGDSDDPHEAVTLRDMTVEGEERIFEQGQRLYRVTPRAVEDVLFPRGARVVGATASDAGITRPADHNEDSLGLVIYSTTHNSRTEPFAIGVVADGLGGHASGMEASRAAVRAVIETVMREAVLPGWGADGAAQELDADAMLRESANAANAAVCAINEAQQIDSGSTLVAALIFGETAWIANMGDSRAYVFDRGQLRRVSADHSLVEQLVTSGMITDEERYSHPQRNQVFRSLGTDEGVEPDVFTISLRPGMRFLLCSDGLWEMVRDPEIARILNETPTVHQAADRLVAAANEHGGEDNIAAVLLEVAG